MTSAPDSGWSADLRQRLRTLGYPVDAPPREFPQRRGEPPIWGYVHPTTGSAVVFTPGASGARVWRPDQVRAADALRVVPTPPAEEDARPQDDTPTLEGRYLDLLQRERTLTAELRVVKTEIEQVEQELARTLVASGAAEVTVGPVHLAPRLRIVVRAGGERVTVYDLRASGLGRWVHESVDHSAMRRELSESIGAEVEAGVALDDARRRFFGAHPLLASKLTIEEEASLSISGERQLHARQRLAWTGDEDEALIGAYRGGTRLAALVERHERAPADIARRLTALLSGPAAAEDHPRADPEG